VTRSGPTRGNLVSVRYDETRFLAFVEIAFAEVMREDAPSGVFFLSIAVSVIYV